MSKKGFQNCIKKKFNLSELAQTREVSFSKESAWALPQIIVDIPNAAMLF